MHLEMAQAIRTAVSQSTTQAYQRLDRDLSTYWAAHYLGHISPDFSFHSDLSREQTHFYQLPLADNDDAIQNMLNAHPQLRQVKELAPENALFVAGYLAHLLYDMIWSRQIITPYFVENKTLGDKAHRRLVHFLLLSWFDQEAYQSLDPQAERWLKDAQPDHWLPFGTQKDLIQWQQMVAGQLEANGHIHTMEIFARRVRLETEEFAAYFSDFEWMETHVFSLISLPEFNRIKAQTVQNSIELLLTYLYN